MISIVQPETEDMHEVTYRVAGGDSVVLSIEYCGGLEYYKLTRESARRLAAAIREELCDR